MYTTFAKRKMKMKKTDWKICLCSTIILPNTFKPMEYIVILLLIIMYSKTLHVHSKIIRVDHQYFAQFTLIDSNKRLVWKEACVQNLTDRATVYQCVGACVLNKNCTTFNYHKEKKICELLNMSKFDSLGILHYQPGWIHYETDDDVRLMGPACRQLNPCKSHEVCEDTFSPELYICKCQDAFDGTECRNYIGPGSDPNIPAASCSLLLKRYRNVKNGKYWIQGNNVQKDCFRKDAICKGKKNGVNHADGCFAYYTCVKGAKNETFCGASTPYFNPTTSSCTAMSPTGCDVNCKHKADGMKHGDGCFAYYTCNKGVKTKSVCGTAVPWFDPTTSTCVANPPVGCDKNCKDKTDGEGYADGCFAYYTCNKGKKTRSVCSTTNEFTPWYDPNGRNCYANPPSGCDETCLGKTDGDKYWAGCIAYYTCNKGVRTELRCGAATPWFDKSTSQCIETPPLVCDYDHLGCFIDRRDRAITGSTTTYNKNIIQSCYARAKTAGYKCFAVQSSKECFTSTTACDTYRKYGTDTGCKNGRGESWRNDVYKIIDYDHIGCFKDTMDRAISGQKTNYLTDTIKLCYERAKREGNLCFGVQFNEECFTSADACATHNKHGKISGCENGRGGPDMIDVYRIPDPTCRGKTDEEKYWAGCLAYFKCDKGVRTEPFCDQTSKPYFDNSTSSCIANRPSGCDYDYLGCFQDKDLAERAIKGSTTKYKTNTIHSCYEKAKKAGNKCFAVQAKWECFTSAKACETYNIHGEITTGGCTNGRGGGFQNAVYRIRDDDCLGKVDGKKYWAGCLSYYKCVKGVRTELLCGKNKPYFDNSTSKCITNRPSECDYNHLGCFKDSGSTRAITGSATKYTTDIIHSCYEQAMKTGNKCFGVQNNDQCWTSANACNTYSKNGAISSCVNGRGGFDKMDVYEIQSECNKIDTVGWGVQLKLHDSIHSWESCSQKCRDTTKCVYWNWYSNKFKNDNFRRRCKLLKSHINTKFNDGTVSGGRNCGL